MGGNSLLFPCNGGFWASRVGLALDSPPQILPPSPMAKSRSSYVCQNCGAITQRWQGKCESCGEWNTIIEEAAALGVGAAAVRRGAVGRPFPLEDLSGDSKPVARIVTGIGELDRVAGGGFVPGSATLIGGEPGIGKSTLLIQACAALARRGGRVVYVSGEESTEQVRLRAARLGLAEAPVQLAAQTLIEDIVATLGSGDAPKFVIVDSIQTMWSDAIESSPGTVSQVRGASQALIRFAKMSGAAMILVGHVTKDGQIAGPRVVEHMVDAVMSFEGEGAHAFRAAARLEEPLRRHRRDRRVRNDRPRARRGRQSLRAVSRRPRRRARPARRCSPASRARARCWSKSRRSWRPRRWARPGARSSAGSRADWRWCWRCWRRTAASSSASTTSTSTSPAACESPSRRPIWPRRPRWCPRWSASPCRTTRSISARSRFRARCARSAMSGFRLKEAAKLGFARAVGPPATRQGGGMRELTASSIGSVASLVAEIAASGVAAKVTK